MRRQWWLGIALLTIPAAWATPRTAVPGTVNYVEGQVSLDGRALTAAQNGSAALAANQMLSVADGKAEVLLSPGSFLRVGSNSEVRMIAPELSDPRVEVVRGEAMLEVDYKPKMARLGVMERGANIEVLKEGLYRFDADEAAIQVIDGKAAVTDNGQTKDVGKGKQVTLSGGPLKTVSFNRKAEDDLYRWSDVRASYLAQANEASAQTIYMDGGWGWGWGPGWFWNPYFDTFAWLPGDGFFWSPFGYPFFSPGYVSYAPYVRPQFYPGAPHSVIRAGRGAVGVGRIGPARSGAPAFRGFAGGRSFGGGGHFAAGGGHFGGGRR
ncbi:MAG: FecR domain-containing protein [Acidobacteriota bacterium]|nr:FecR domain-containing protein [Acidobacteriota bacterium]